MAGYSQAELDDVQAKWQLRFPPDLVDLLRERRPLMDDPQCFDWVTADPEHIRERLAWPFESYWVSIERHELWWPEWGERPSKPSDQCEKVRAIFAADSAAGAPLPSRRAARKWQSCLLSFLFRYHSLRRQPEALVGARARHGRRLADTLAADQGHSLLGAGGQVRQ
jgi:hypothetical protein